MQIQLVLGIETQHVNTAIFENLFFGCSEKQKYPNSLISVKYKSPARQKSLENQL